LPSWLTFNPSKKALSGIPNTAGTLKIKVSATDTANASASTTFNLVIKDTPASLNQNHERPFLIFPNPTNGKFTISFASSPNLETSIEIYDLLGNLVFSKTFQDTASETIDLTGHSKGIYLVKSWTVGELKNQKVCIK
jgi:hypothetical protein